LGYIYPIDVLPPEVKDFLDDYRSLKPKIFMETGVLYGVTGTVPNREEISKKYFHGMFYAGGGDNYDPAIYVLPNECSILSVKLIKNEEMEYTDRMNKVIKTTKEDHYIINTEERIIGVINNGNIDYSRPQTYVYAKNGEAKKIIYDIYITSDGPKIQSQNSFGLFYVLERDVPILMEKINDLALYHHFINQLDAYSHNKTDKYVVEWWYK
jgi:hypothetical protein